MAVHTALRVTLEQAADTLGPSCAISGVEVIGADGLRIPILSAREEAGEPSGTQCLIDDSDPGEWRGESVVLHFAPAEVLAYRLRSGGDPALDPVRWTVELRKDNEDLSASGHEHYDMWHEADARGLACFSGARRQWTPYQYAHGGEGIELLDEAAELEARAAQLRASVAAEQADGESLGSAGRASSGRWELEQQLRRARDAVAEKRGLAEAKASKARNLLAQADMMRRGTDSAREEIRSSLSELLEVIAEKEAEEEELEEVDPVATLSSLKNFSDEREDELLKVNRDIDTALVDDGKLTQSLTTLQNRLQVEEPKEEEKGEEWRRDILSGWDKERRQLERCIDGLEEQYRMYYWHEHRGTNIKAAWGTRKADRTGGSTGASKTSKTAPSLWREGGGAFDEDTGMTLQMEHDLRRMGERHDDLKEERMRLVNTLKDRAESREKREAQLKEEEGQLRAQYDEAHRERSALGQERTDLEAVCADFSLVIERRLEQQQLELGLSGRPPGMPTGPPPIGAGYTIGHGRLSPRPAPSPRAVVGPSPMRGSRATGTPRSRASRQGSRSPRPVAARGDAR